MKSEPLEFEVDGLKLRGNFYGPAPPAKKLAVLFIHGWTGLPNDSAAEFLARHGYISMTFSLSGHNNSDGRLKDQTRQKSLKEVLAAYDFFKSKLPVGARVVSAGNSYGGYLATLLSTERPLAAIQMRVPANYPDARFSAQQLNQGSPDPDAMFWRQKELGPDVTRSLKALHNFNGEVQIIEAEADEHVPHQTVQNYVNAIVDKSKLDYHLMKDCSHSLGLDKERNRQYQQLTLDWLDKLA
ncbi:MAG TPA: alpha/beta fold hydrolase [Candidatus Saccharimonadales bacterium]|nr:alpha/beta fold hydrolase [Candidatus Saccharimonadales bacterium]